MMRRHHFSRVPHCICVVNYEEHGQKYGTQAIVGFFSLSFIFIFIFRKDFLLEDERGTSPHALTLLMSMLKSVVRLHSASAPFLPHCLYFPPKWAVTLESQRQ